MKKKKMLAKICPYCTWYITATRKCFKGADTTRVSFCVNYKSGYSYKKDNPKYVEEP